MQMKVCAGIRVATLIVAGCLTTFGGLAQESATTPATSAVPNLVHYTGILKDVTGKTLADTTGVTFLLYKDEQGGTPLWMETQNITPDASGHYDVQLGSTSANGIPADIFQTGQARWLAVQIASEAEQPRVMLVAVAYAMKAADAATIGGLPPSAFVMAPTANRSGTTGAAPATAVQSSVGTSRQSASGSKTATPTAHTPAGTIPVTTAGGTVNFVPLWDATSDISNSILFQANAKSGTRIGVNTTSPVSTLDVKGTETVRGNLSMPALGTATVNSSFNSEPLTFTASAFSGAPVAQNFRWQAEPTNNFGLVSGSMNLLYASGNNTFTETGLTLDPFGDLRATTLNANSVFGGSAVPASAPVFALNSDTTAVSSGVIGETSSSVFGAAGVTGSGPGFGVVGYTSSTISSPGSGVLGWATAGSGTAQGVQGFTQSYQGVGVYGASISASGISVQGAGVWGDSSFGSGVVGTTNGGGAAVYGNNTSSQCGYCLIVGVSGFTTDALGAGVYGNTVGPSNVSKIAFVGYEPSAGVWGDTSSGIGVLGSADNAPGGLFFNTGGMTSPTLEALNYGSVDGMVFEAGGYGSLGYFSTCTIDTSANFTCNGPPRSVVRVDGGQRQVALSAIESPVNWFEDAGSAQLANGAAVVALDSEFIQTVNLEKEYQVFLTPYGDCKGLYVTNRTARSFEVHELGGGTASINFGYRIMAVRKNYENVRFADVTATWKQMEQRAQEMRVPKQVASSPKPASRTPRTPATPRGRPPVLAPPARASLGPVLGTQTIQK